MHGPNGKLVERDANYLSK